MLHGHPKIKERLEDVARSMDGPFTYEELHTAVWNCKNDDGRDYKSRPSVAEVQSLLFRAPWARPVGERMVQVGNNSPRARTIYIFDEEWGAERKAMRLKGVEA